MYKTWTARNQPPRQGPKASLSKPSLWSFITRSGDTRLQTSNYPRNLAWSASTSQAKSGCHVLCSWTGGFSRTSSAEPLTTILDKIVSLMSTEALRRHSKGPLRCVDNQVTHVNTRKVSKTSTAEQLRLAKGFGKHSSVLLPGSLIPFPSLLQLSSYLVCES